MESTLSPAQKGLLFVLYGLLILMIIFSFNARKNIGEDGFNKCIQWKCEKGGEEYCSKVREITNCCLGAGGKMTQTGCVFSPN